MAAAHTIAVSTHGRYLTEAPAADPTGLLIGCHGYGENADIQLERLRSVAGAGAWLLVSIQGLHRFYRSRTDEVVASWMTRQDRECAIADNVAFVSAVVDEVASASRVESPLVFAGFSQGVAMAFRAACGSTRSVGGVIAVGGDVPPEIGRGELARIPIVLLARGERDEWYTAAKWTADQARLRDAGVDVRAVAFDGGHEWHDAVNREAAALLQRTGAHRV
ncbi:MAG: hypothetical protein A3H97_12365 [Acidobacteria bacterium RIFCSPLOWO2_02_FULL_65_29]|nr:MAG: hypothetical protein A3H97_12365 [Acidobacteria bacterium RIFCSPLOWO2_02_FULL_65_29]